FPALRSRGTILRAILKPPGPVASQTSPKPPRPSGRTRRYPGTGSAPASRRSPPAARKSVSASGRERVSAPVVFPGGLLAWAAAPPGGVGGRVDSCEEGGAGGGAPAGFFGGRGVGRSSGGGKGMGHLGAGTERRAVFNYRRPGQRIKQPRDGFIRAPRV